MTANSHLASPGYLGGRPSLVAYTGTDAGLFKEGEGVATFRKA